MATDPWEQLRNAITRNSDASSDFDLNSEVALPEGRILRPAGVLIPLLETPAGIDVILTKRSSVLKHHPGQIAFPGGKVDPSDVSPTAAALREAHEEIGLDPDNVEVMGTLPQHETVTKFTVVPVLGRVRQDFEPKPEPGEVEEVFRVPLSHVSDIGRFQIQSRDWRGSMRHYYAIPYGPYYIWGATARILRGLAGRMVA